MSNNTAKIEEGTSDSVLLNKALRKIRYKIIAIPAFFLVTYLILKITSLYEWKYGEGMVVGSFIGTIIAILVNEIKPRYIFKYNIVNGNLELFRTNIFGSIKIVSISLNQISKIKYRSNGLWRGYAKVWIHLETHVEEYFIIEDKLGKDLVNNIDVEKI